MAEAHDHRHAAAHGPGHNPDLGDHDHDDRRGGHGHAGHAGHSHAPASFGRAFAIGIALNGGFVLAEAAAGLRSGSVALLADAGHNLSDVLGLAMAWGGHALANRRPSERFTYGLRSSSILAALANALLLILACGAIALEGIRRLVEGDTPANGGVVMLVAAVGVVINLATALLFARGRSDLNLRGAYLHMAADAAVSAGVVVAGFVTARTGLAWIDPATSLAIVVAILFSTWGLLRDSVALALNGVPPGIDLAQVEARLGALPGVARVHHVHVWPTSTTEAALTAHLVIPGGADDGFLAKAATMLDRDFAIGHATLQVERGEACARDGC